MNHCDLLCLAGYVAVLSIARCRDSLLVAASFMVSVLYTSSSIWDVHPSYVNHLIIAMCFVPAAMFTSKNVSITLLAYSIYHWIVAGDYIAYPDAVTLISSTFWIVSPLINLMIMAVLVNDGRHGKTLRLDSLDLGWLPHAIHHALHNKKMAGRK